MSDEKMITISKAEHDALLQDRSRIAPYLRVLWKSRWAWFLAGMLLATGMMFPFVSGEAKWWRQSPITITTVSPNQIAKFAPNSTTSDKTKRNILIRTCQRTSDMIRQQALTSTEHAMTELRTGTISLQYGQWQRVIDALDVYLSGASDIEALADKLDEIILAFTER